MLVKDQIVRKFFLNLTVTGTQIGERRDGKPVLSYEITGYKLTALYAKLLESQLLATGRPAMNILELVSYSIKYFPEILNFSRELESLMTIQENVQLPFTLIY